MISTTTEKEEEEESVSIYLRCKTAAEEQTTTTTTTTTTTQQQQHESSSSSSGICAEFSLALYRTDHTLSHITHCPTITKFGRKRRGYPTFISRHELFRRENKLIDERVGGTVTVVVSIQLYAEEGGCSNSGGGGDILGVGGYRRPDLIANGSGSSKVKTMEYFVPNMEKNVYCRLLRLWEEANPGIDRCCNIDVKEEVDSRSRTLHSSDVTFSIDGETLHAHSLILNMMAPTLASLCTSSDSDDDDDDNEGNNNVPIPIVGVRVEIFRYLLRYLYGGSIPEDVWNKNNSNIFQHPSMELLDASNRFGVVDLKILAEVHVVQTLICIENASDLFLYADANNCALLKERVLHYFKDNAQEIRRHPSFQKVKESTDALDQLIEALTSSREYDDRRMSVDMLRRKLHERGLDVDGSREMLIQRLAKWEENKEARAKARARSCM